MLYCSPRSAQCLLFVPYETNPYRFIPILTPALAPGGEAADHRGERLNYPPCSHLRCGTHHIATTGAQPMDQDMNGAQERRKRLLDKASCSPCGPPTGTGSLPLPLGLPHMACSTGAADAWRLIRHPVLGQTSPEGPHKELPLPATTPGSSPKCGEAALYDGWLGLVKGPTWKKLGGKERFVSRGFQKKSVSFENELLGPHFVSESAFCKGRLPCWPDPQRHQYDEKDEKKQTTTEDQGILKGRDV